MLYPTELSSGGSHLALASAYATAKPRAPDGRGIRTAVASRNDFRIAASCEAAISLRDAVHGAARISWNSLRMHKKNAPGTASEGIRVSSEDRVTDLPLAGTGQSMESRPSYAQRANGPASRIGCAALRLSAMWLRVADMVWSLLCGMSARSSRRGSAPYCANCECASGFFETRRTVGSGGKDGSRPKQGYPATVHLVRTQSPFRMAAIGGGFSHHARSRRGLC